MKGMRNKGQITVFVCLMVCVFLMLVLTVLQGIRIREGEAKCSQSVSAACKSIKGDYQPDLFRRYHILALDKTYYGKGEGFLEQRMEEFLEYNLMPQKTPYHFQVQEVMLTKSQSLTEDSMEGFRQQIHEYMKLRTPQLVLERVFQKTEPGQSLDRDTVQRRLENQAEQTVTIESGQTINVEKQEMSKESLLLPIEETGVGEEVFDPRGAMKLLLGMDILDLVIPDKVMAVSKETVDLTNVPSNGKGMTSKEFWTFQGDMLSLPDLADAFRQETFWKDIGRLAPDGEITEGMENFLEGPLYAIDTFQNAGSWDGENNRPLEFEAEYLLAGLESDYKNLSKVATELAWIRFIPNMCYACSDQTMKEETLALATVLLAPVGLAELAEPVSYVILGGWAYGESLVDVKALLHGKAVPVTKDQTTWNLSLRNLSDISRIEEPGCEESKGMTYEEYLFLMLALQNTEQLHYRMLDIMQLNIQEDIPEFRIENCVVGFEVQVTIQENNRQWHFQNSEGYLSE